MSRAVRQSTLVEAARAARKARLPWDSDNPLRAPVPDLHEKTARRYYETPDELPYEVPTLGGTEQTARNKHRTWFWLEHPFGEHVCPDCGRSVAKCKAVDVHHIDENPRNGAPENLAGLCRYCHRQRHGKGGRRTMRPIGVWMREFPADMEVGE